MSAVCERDSGSATDCQPMCSAPAALEVRPSSPVWGLPGRYCKRHVLAELGRLADPRATVWTLDGEPYDTARLPRSH